MLIFDEWVGVYCFIVWSPLVLHFICMKSVKQIILILVCNGYSMCPKCMNCYGHALWSSCGQQILYESPIFIYRSMQTALPTFQLIKRSCLKFQFKLHVPIGERLIKIVYLHFSPNRQRSDFVPETHVEASLLRATSSLHVTPRETGLMKSVSVSDCALNAWWNIVLRCKKYKEPFILINLVIGCLVLLSFMKITNNNQIQF